MPYIVWYVMKRKKTEPTLQISDARMYMHRHPKSWKIYSAAYPFRLRIGGYNHWLSWSWHVPQTTDSWQNTEIEGIDIMLASGRFNQYAGRRFETQPTGSCQTSGFRVHQRPPRMIISESTIFAGESFTQCPLTVDHGVLLNLFNSIKGDIAQRGLIEDGTAIGMGIANAVTRLKDSKAKSKVIILLTDGSNNRGDISPLTAAEIAKQFWNTGSTPSVSEQTELLLIRCRPTQGRKYVNAPVEIDEKTLTEIAGTTNGNYFRATSNSQAEGSL